VSASESGGSAKKSPKPEQDEAPRARGHGVAENAQDERKENQHAEPSGPAYEPPPERANDTVFARPNRL